MQQLLFNHRGAVTAFRLGALGVRSWAGCLGRGGGIGRCRRGGGDCLICFCLIFDCYYGNFFSWKESGCWALPSFRFGIFQLFHYFSECFVLSCPATCVQCFLYKISSIVLLVANQIYNKIFIWCVLCPRCCSIRLVLLSVTLGT